MSDRSRSGSAEGAGDEIRPYGEEHDSSEESEDDPEEAKRIAEGFIVDNDDDDDDEDEEEEEERKPLTKEERRQKRRDAKRRKKEQREARKKELLELSDDELELLQENQGGPSHRPAKRAKRDGEEGGDDAGRGAPGLQDIFADDDGRGPEDDDDDDLGDFIEESEDEEGGGETEEQRRERKRQEKLKRREAKKAKPDAAGVDKVAWDEIHEVFGDGTDFDWALDAQGEGGDVELDEEVKKNLRLEDVFDPAEIKERRLQDEDRVLAQRDRPERHQLVNSTLSDNPVIAPDSVFPDPELAASYAFNKISLRTQYLFCGMHDENDYPVPTADYPSPPPAQRRYDLATQFHMAVARALSMMFVHHLEVPYLWHYKRDAFSVLEQSGRSSVQFLDRDELWKLFELGIRFRAIHERNNYTTAIWDKIKTRRETPELSVAERYLEDKLLRSICMMSIEAAAEGGDWLEYHYRDEIRRIKETESAEDGVIKKLPAKAAQDDLRSGPILKLVEAFGIVVSQVAMAFNDLEGVPIAPTNPEKRPYELAEEFSGPGTTFTDAEVALRAASQILATEFFKDPSIRQQARDFMEACATVSVVVNDKGMVIIDEYHLYSTFKFLTGKPVLAFKESPQFLHILQAEEEGLLEITVDVPEAQIEAFAATLVRCCQSDQYGEISKEWNAQREAVCSDVVREKLIPMGRKWLKEHLRGEAEDYIAERCRMELEFRVNVRPYQGKGMESGETPSVLAITTGRGDVRDAVIAIILDQEGNIRSQNKFDNLKDELNKAAFFELLDKRAPQVVAIGGLSVHTARLKEDATNTLRDYAIQRFGENPPVQAAFDDPEYIAHELAHFDDRLKPHMIPMIFPSDATARLYMTSEEAEKEHPTLPANGRYALALARYTQNPLNSYCKVARSISSVTFVEHHQKLISNEKLLLHLERGLVNAVCSTGIEVNSCVADPYERVMLPFIAGLGPRKADLLINTILKQGSLINRLGFSDIFGPTVFENVAGFLTIESDISAMILEEQNPQDQPDPLDKTRIHPEDYEFAQKMCQDALDYDAEDVADQHKSDVVLQLMVDSQRHLKLGELNLDDFAFNLQKQGEGNKRHVLGEIVGELISWRADRRPQFYVPTDWEIVQMLTGETERTIGRGLRVTATVRRALASRAFCQLESGMDAILEREYIQDEDPYQQIPELRSCEDVLKPRQAVKAVVIVAEPARFQVRISTRESDLAQAIPFVQPFRDEYYNSQMKRVEAEELLKTKQRKIHGSTKRKVDHPNFHDMNSGQAEQFLASLQRGDVVIRRSSKGPDHLAITWKVDEDVFQHIDVEELNKPNEYAVGRVLKVGKYSYMDLDDLIINHVKAMARKFDEMQLHEKYRPEHELENYLKNYVQAHPGRSMYGFSIDSERPGYLKLCFLNKSTKDGGVVQTWPVKVLPGAYRLNNAEVPGVMELCNAFKAQYSNKLLDQGTGGKTPGIRAGKTPMGGRTPGGRTPAVGMGRGGATPMYGGRTPMPGQTPYGAAPMTAYAGNATPYNGYPGGAGGYGGPPQGYPPAPQAGYGGPPPPQAGYGMPPPRPAAGMNPDRAAMLGRQQGGGGRY